MALVILAAVLVGATLQRIAGMGLGLVVAPLLSVLLGPVTGVLISNAAGGFSALLVLVVLRGDVDWRRFTRMAPLIVLGSILGALTVRAIGSAWLEILVGATVLLALSWTLLVGARVRPQGVSAALGAGTAAGFMNTTAGVAGPAMTVYAVATDWQQRSFAATLQPVFLLASVSALVSKGALGSVPAGGVAPWWVWAMVAVAVATGVGLGGVGARWVSSGTARRAAVSIAMLGAVLTLARGVGAL